MMEAFACVREESALCTTTPTQDNKEHNTTQHNTTQHNTTQHNTTHTHTTQHNTTQHNTTQHIPTHSLSPHSLTHTNPFHTHTNISPSHTHTHTHTHTHMDQCRFWDLCSRKTCHARESLLCCGRNRWDSHKPLRVLDSLSHSLSLSS